MLSEPWLLLLLLQSTSHTQAGWKGQDGLEQYEGLRGCWVQILLEGEPQVLLLTRAALGRTAMPPGFPWAVRSGVRSVALQGHPRLPAEPTARECLPLCCTQAVEIRMSMGLIVLQGLCFLFLKYKWPIGTEILTNTKIEPEHCLLVEMFTGWRNPVTTQRYCL